MTDFGSELLVALHRVDDEMRRTGAPAIHPRWWAALEAFYSSGKRQLVIRKSRRIGASSIVAARLVVASYLVLRKRLRVPAGETATLACVSVKRSEATARLKNVDACLTALKIPHRPTGDGIELDGSFDVRVLTASARSEVGQLLAFLWCDEVSRWLDSDTGANPASEVLAALKPALATIPDARIFLASTPLTHDDYHARTYAEGDNEAQATVFLAPSWECNPQLTEQACRQLERDPRRFAREYEGIPSDASIDSYFEGTIEQSIDPMRRCEGCFQLKRVPSLRYSVAIDPGFRRDAFAIAVAHRERCKTGSLSILDHCIAIRPTATRAVDVQDAVRTAKRIARDYGCHSILCDQHHQDTLAALFREPPDIVLLNDATWTTQSKTAKFEAVRNEMQAGRVRFSGDPELLRELRNIGSRILPSGFEQIAARGSGHDDMACAAVMALADAMELTPLYPGSIDIFSDDPRGGILCGTGDFGGNFTVGTPEERFLEAIQAMASDGTFAAIREGRNR